MADNYPRVTEADLQRARFDRVHGLLAGIGGGLLATGAFSIANAPGGWFPRKFIGGFLGIEVKPQPGRSFGPGVHTFPRLGIPGLFLPQPLGLVPAEAYGLTPNIVQETLGFRMGRRPMFLNPDASRVKEFEARQFADALLRKATTGPANQYDPNSKNYEVRPGPLRISREELDYLASLPRDVHPGLFVVPALEDRFNETREAPVSDADRAQVVGHLVRLVQRDGTTTQAIEAPGGNYLRIDATGRIVK